MMVLDGVDDGSRLVQIFSYIFFIVYLRCFKRSHCYEKENSAPLLMVIKKMTLKSVRELWLCVCYISMVKKKKN